MCGIAGIVSPSGLQPTDMATLERMTDALAHRGPDDAAFHRVPGVAFGFRRLAIIDLDGGRQPIGNEDGSVVMVCNGEIYDYRDLRRSLAERGHVMRTAVDVEVLVHLYEERGLNFLDGINGQFALALHDRRRGLVVLARDQVGIAPLFYTMRDGVLVFASETGALRLHPLARGGIDLTGLDQVITFPGPISPRTLFAGVQSLPPGHLLVIRDGDASVHPYWDLDYPPREDAPTPGAAPDFEDLAARLRRAVARRLQADVPVGFYLSGGLDSSLVAALVHQVDAASGATRRRHAFSIGFPDARIDERTYQDLVAQATGAHHHVEIFDADAIQRRLRLAVRHAAAPLKESYNTCSLALSERVRGEGLKVVLTGEGADELFGGYVGYRMQPAPVPDGGLEAELEADMRRRLWGDPGFFYERSYAAFTEVKTALYAPRLAGALETFDCCRAPVINPRRIIGRHPIHQRSYVDFKLRLADHLLADHGDRVNFAHSVEGRYPFLDPEVIDWVRAAPPGYLVHNGVEKYPLRRIAGACLPPAIVHRQKFGFVAPSCAVLLQAGVEWVEDLLSHARIRAGGYFNADTVERLKQIYRTPGYELTTTFETDLLMIVLTFEILRDCFAIPSL